MRDPSPADDLRARAQAAFAEGRLDDAQRLFVAALAASPDSAAAHHDLGGFFKGVGRLDEAEAELRAAHALAPDDPRTRHALGIVLLAQGRYVEGWPFYDARHAVPELRLLKPALPYPAWDGSDVRGKRLLVFPEQGLGDQLMFARFAPWLAARGADVTLLCHPALARLFAQSFAGVRVLSAAGQVDFPDPDAWVMSGSLAGRAGVEPDTLPSAPYLHAAAGLGGDSRIGVVTRGNPSHSNDRQRSLPPALGAELLALPGATSLEPEQTGARDFADTAAIVAGLDLVITVDTAVAHLAGALGKPVWILLPRLMTDWRWLEGREDSPWYPSARLFRQAAPGDWRPVLDAIRSTLAEK